MRFLLLLILASVCLATEVDNEGFFEYKHSFKGPYFFVRQSTIPFWETLGTAVITEQYVRLTPNVQSRWGAIWNQVPVIAKEWSVEIVAQISGDGKLGGDGMAFWYTADKLIEGPVYGNTETFRGIMIAMDTFDNDDRRNNPYVGVWSNDGKKVVYPGGSDGFGTELAGCKLSIRKTKEPFHLRFTYKDRTLRAEYDIGSTSTHEYRMCFVAPDLDLPTGYYFGLSSQTGGLADNHDVYSFTTRSYNVNEPTQRINPRFADLPKAQPVPVALSQSNDQLTEMYAEVMKLKAPGDNTELLNSLAVSITKIQEHTESLSKSIMRISSVLSTLGGSDDKITDLNAKTQFLIQQIKDSRDREDRERERIQREIGAIGRVVASQSSYVGWGIVGTVSVFGALVGGFVMWLKKSREQRSRKLL